jgi:DNA/RNA endonuclease G (NUC1)
LSNCCSFTVTVLSAVTNIQVSNVGTYQRTNVVITWASVPGQGYSILRTNNLRVPTTNWPVIATGYSGSGSSLSFTDYNAVPTVKTNFYRIRWP